MLLFKPIITNILIFFFIAFSLQSCLTYKEIVNFQDGEQLGIQEKMDSVNNERLVRMQPDDVIQINIFSYNQESADKFNTIDARMQAQVARGGVGGGSNITEPLGYRVDSKGLIDFPVLGQISVIGLTIEELRDMVHEKITATGYLKDLSVQIRFLSFRITVLGEVANPGTFIIANTKITVLEAIGLARDVTIYSNRDNILVIREQNGVREYGRINLKSREIFNSPFYYMQPNDVLYVEPHRTKVLNTQDAASRYSRTIVSVLSLVSIFIALLR